MYQTRRHTFESALTVAKEAMPPLAEADVVAFQRDGFLLVPGLVDAATVAA